MNITQKVAKIVDDVKKYGDDAVIKYTFMFDNVKFKKSEDMVVKIHPVRIVNKSFIQAINLAIKNVRQFHTDEYKNLKKSWMTRYNNIIAGQKFVPVESVGVYIPGGKYGYNYISTLIMTVIPAQVAGVKKIVVVTPPRNVTDYFIYTVYRLGIKQIYRVGGVQAISALAFGTKTIPKVDMIIGPGNVWVTEAKRQLVGVVGIDLLAGPSEVVVVADDSYSVEEIVCELLAQAEHDKDAKCYLIGLDKNIVESIKSFLNKNAKEFIPQIEVMFEKDIKKICDVINKIAPEHLTLLTKKFSEIVKLVKNVGAVFYGVHPSAVFGDYIAGPSHVLPTNHTARFSSGLSVLSFLKKISIVKFSTKSIQSLSELTSTLAEVEGMTWHSKRVKLISGETNAKESKN